MTSPSVARTTSSRWALGPCDLYIASRQRCPKSLDPCGLGGCAADNSSRNFARNSDGAHSPTTSNQSPNESIWTRSPGPSPSSSAAISSASGAACAPQLADASWKRIRSTGLRPLWMLGSMAAANAATTAAAHSADARLTRNRESAITANPNGQAAHRFVPSRRPISWRASRRETDRREVEESCGFQRFLLVRGQADPLSCRMRVAVA